MIFAVNTTIGGETFMLPKLDPGFFDWLTWRSGTPLDLLGVRHCKTSDLLRCRNILKEHAIGYCEGEAVPCRAKEDTKAVMYFIDNKHFWFHLSNYEFYAIFGDTV